jgi:hypothetical protein
MTIINFGNNLLVSQRFLSKSIYKICSPDNFLLKFLLKKKTTRWVNRIQINQSSSPCVSYIPQFSLIILMQANRKCNLYRCTFNVIQGWGVRVFLFLDIGFWKVAFSTFCDYVFNKKKRTKWDWSQIDM